MQDRQAPAQAGQQAAGREVHLQGRAEPGQVGAEGSSREVET